VRRAFTSFQLMTILEENYHSFLIVEHDPLLYEGFLEMVGYLAQVLKQISRETAVLLCTPYLDSPATRNVARAGRSGVLHLQ